MLQSIKDIISPWKLDSEIKIDAIDIEYNTKRDSHVWTVNEKLILIMIAYFSKNGYMDIANLNIRIVN